MSVVATVKQGRFKSDAQAAQTFLCEKKLYSWIMKIGDTLNHQVVTKTILRSEAIETWELKKKCYRCCVRAVREGRLP